MQEMLSSVENSLEWPYEPWKFKTAFGLIAHYGQQFDKIGKLPEGTTLGTPRLCYHNAFKRIGGDLLYTEGYMLICGVPIMHGWLTDVRTMEVIEVTLERPADEYFGVIFRTGYVVDMAYRTKCAGIFDCEQREIIQDFRMNGLPEDAIYNPAKGERR